MVTGHRCGAAAIKWWTFEASEFMHARLHSYLAGKI
jgi:hypothetical protein